MFVGHYAPSFAGKALRRTIPLWVLVLAVQWIDVLWAVFVLLGIEKVRIVPGITAANPLDLFYMPYTHSVVAAMLWSAAAAVVYDMRTRARSWADAGVIGGAVFSHWIFDLLVHRPDLPLYGDTAKVGLGLWNYPLPALALEVTLLLVGMSLYARGGAPVGAGGRVRLVSFGVVVLTLQGWAFFGPPPSSDTQAAVMALAAYSLVTAGAYWLERPRTGSMGARTGPRPAGRPPGPAPP